MAYVNIDIELEDFEKLGLSNHFSLSIKKYDFYDSALFINLQGLKIFNLNDFTGITYNYINNTILLTDI
jgi:hypothetical protein